MKPVLSLPKPKCRTCKFAEVYGDTTLKCRCAPPLGSYGIWPMVKEDDWCGEWEKK